MATRKPLVIVDGQLRQMASGDILDAQLNEVDFVPVTNDEANAIVICTPVYVNGEGTVKKAKADALSTSEVLGLVVDTSIAASASGRVLTDGRFTATTGQWDVVTGDVGGLTPGSVYYLNPTTAGKLTTTAPIADSEVVARIGKALSATVLEISINQPILL